MKRIFTLSLIFTTTLCFGQIVSYDMSSIPAGQLTTSVPPSSSDPSVTASDLSRGGGLTPETGVRSINSSNWSSNMSAEAGKFYVFTITPATTNNLAITGLTFNIRSSGTGPQTIELFTQNQGEAEVSRGIIVSPPSSDGTRNFPFIYNTNGAPLTFRIYGYNASAGTGTFRINSLTVNGTAPLPVTLISFKAATLGQETVLNWNTADAVNFSHFSVERSTDAKSFEAIGRVEALSAHSSTETFYSFTDGSPTYGLNYYRLKQVDVDNSYAYSKMVSVNMTEASPVVVYPNPVSSVLRLKNSEKDGVRFYGLFDANGRSVREIDGSRPELLVTDLADGIYNLQLMDQNNTIITRRFIKQ